MRGLPGSGKSTMAVILRDFYEAQGLRVEIVSADDFFVKRGKGVYDFDASLLGHAHRECFDEFYRYADNPDVDVIIVDNTNMTSNEMNRYMRDFSPSQVQFITVGRVKESYAEFYKGRGTHNVPLEVYERMISKYQP